MRAYFVPEAPVTAAMEVKKSRFVTVLAPAGDITAAKAVIQQVRAAHPSAAHHCWAFVVGPPGDGHQAGFSDDGEPPGTAGKPMLAQLTGSTLGDIAAVVVRYYGGIHLGTGGLVKAYGGGVQQALKLVKRVEKIPLLEFRLVCRYEQQSWVETVVKQAEGQIVRGDYGESIILRVVIPFNRIALAQDKLRDLSRGALQLTPVR